MNIACTGRTFCECPVHMKTRAAWSADTITEGSEKVQQAEDGWAEAGLFGKGIRRVNVFSG